MTLTRDEILSKRAALPRSAVDVPELGGAVLIRALTLRQMGEIQAFQKRDPDPQRLNAKLLIMSVINEDDSSVFTDADKAAIEELPFGAVNAVVDAILVLNRMKDEPDPKASKDGDSDSGSPPSSEGQ